jgi:putative copper export protein
VPLFVALVGGELSRARESVLALARRSAWVAILLVALYQMSEPIRLAGDVRGVLDVSLHSALLASPLGTATVVRALGLLLIAIGCGSWDRHGSTVALLGAAFVVASFAFMGHTAEDDQRWLTAAALLVHTGAVAFWFGSLLPLHQASRRESLTTNGALLERFSYVAVRIVPAIFVAGLALAVALLPSLASLRTSYGLLLLTKVAGFSVLMAAASLNKVRFGPRVRSGDAAALVALRRVVLAEWLLMAAVIATTSTMTGLFSPER